MLPRTRFSQLGSLRSYPVVQYFMSFGIADICFIVLLLSSASVCINQEAGRWVCLDDEQRVATQSPPPNGRLACQLEDIQRPIPNGSGTIPFSPASSP